MQKEKDLIIYKYKPDDFDPDRDDPMFSLKGILDTEKRYFPMNFVAPELKNCLLNFKVSYEFDRHYNLNNETNDTRAKTDAELEMDLRLNKYRHREYQENNFMGRSELNDLYDRIEKAKQKKIDDELKKKNNESLL